MKAEILAGISQEAPLDGVYLELHGAGVVDGIPDLEGDHLRPFFHLVGITINVHQSPIRIKLSWIALACAPEKYRFQPPSNRMTDLWPVSTNPRVAR
jgi:hypothetical protein